METSVVEIEDMLKVPASHSIAKIKVLRDMDGKVPYNKQVGATCGIYALDAALQIQGQKFAARKHLFGDWRAKGIPRKASLRGRAKYMGLSQIGEIDGAMDLARLAAELGIKVPVVRFDSEAALWKLVQDAVNSGHGIVMPYACADDSGAPAWAMRSDGFAHWCLLFGYAEYALARGLKRVFMTTYGHYHEISPYRVFKSNQRVQDWPRQTWVKLTFWEKRKGNTNWGIYGKEWQAQATLAEDLKQIAAGFAQEGWGFGIGDDKNVQHILVDPANSISNLNVPSAALANATLKSAHLEHVAYTQTMRGQCVVV